MTTVQDSDVATTAFRYSTLQRIKVMLAALGVMLLPATLSVLSKRTAALSLRSVT